MLVPFKVSAITFPSFAISVAFLNNRALPEVILESLRKSGWSPCSQLPVEIEMSTIFVGYKIVLMTMASYRDSGKGIKIIKSWEFGDVEVTLRC